MSKEEQSKIQEVETQALQLLQSDTDGKSSGQKTAKPSASIGEKIVHTLTECEPHWSQWKEERCPSFEKKGSLSVHDKIARRREAKLQMKEQRKLSLVTCTP